MNIEKYKEASRHTLAEDLLKDVSRYRLFGGLDASIDPVVAWFHHMHETQPVRYRPEYDLWEVFRYKDTEEVLLNYATFSIDKCVPSGMPFALAMTDLPEHRQLRSLVSKAFTPRSLEELKPHIVEIVEELLELGMVRGKMSLFTELAHPLMMRVMAKMLGLPPSDQERFLQWAQQLRMQLVGVEHSVDHSELLQYFSDLLDKRKRDPRDDLISAVLAAEENGPYLTYEKKLFLCVELMTANPTTIKLLTHALSRLSQYPEIYQDLRNDPSLIPRAIEETLRYDFNLDLWRTARHDTVLGGQQIKAGQYVVAWTGGANCDETYFPHSEQFDIRRSPNPHLTFSHGIHSCLGAPLARLLVRVTLEWIVTHCSEIHLDSEKSLQSPGEKNLILIK